MAPRDTTLFFLVFCLGQKIQAQDGNLSIPTLSATPGSVIPWNEYVKVLCQGTPGSYLYQLEILGNSTYKVVEAKLRIQEMAEFVINRMDTNTAGRYRCQYKKHFSQSVYSEALELVVTGLYDKPFLSTDGGLVVMTGANVSLRCRSAHISLDRFSLSKEGGAPLSQRQNGGHWGDFILGPVNLNFSGIYTCYSWYSGSPYVWSAPSNALELVVTDTINKDYTTENLIRMGVAGLVLVVLLAILAENWLGHQVPHKEDQQDLPELSWSRQKTQAEWSFGLTTKGHQETPGSEVEEPALEFRKATWRT
ncbi:immunoglobulin alpha Fc receptor [Hippopotamus amphibius kiboko]|uniref:immunoglobulin alpha Fc receptor n=1 Tax=Hippopotamus amphibius kiboko TaxID=575201 RepID=UPI00259A4C76|nr:immunoglobulin alpha Fc receptor [Hippopotamus amphibius kiboko]